MADQRTAWIEAALSGCPTAAFQSRLRQELEGRAREMSTQAKAAAPAGFTTVTPFISVVDVERLISFAKEAFGAVEEHRTTGSAGGPFCIMRIGDSMLMFTGGAPVKGREKLNALHFHVPDADVVYQQALTAGARSLSPPSDQRWGDRVGGVEDAWGNTWYIASPSKP